MSKTSVNSAVLVLILLFGCLGYTNSQKDLPIPGEALDKLAGAIDLNGFNASVLPSLEEGKNLFKQKCDKNGGPHAFDNAKNAQEDMTQCLSSLINITKLQEDMEKYKPTGDLDIVFKEYCRKTPIFRSCVMNFTAAVEPCLEPKERENKRFIQNITDSLLDFVCYKEGDRIAIFISAGGPECFESQRQGIQDCVNSTVSTYIAAPTQITGGLPGLESLPALVFGEKECSDILRLQSCTVKELEKCADPTTANIVESIFTFILKVTPCDDLLKSEKIAADGMRSGVTTGSASYLTILSLGLLLLNVL